MCKLINNEYISIGQTYIKLKEYMLSETSLKLNSLVELLHEVECELLYGKTLDNESRGTLQQVYINVTRYCEEFRGTFECDKILYDTVVSVIKLLERFKVDYSNINISEELKQLNLNREVTLFYKDESSTKIIDDFINVLEISDYIEDSNILLNEEIRQVLVTVSAKKYQNLLEKYNIKIFSKVSK